jgi:hypothetical protein
MHRTNRLLFNGRTAGTLSLQFETPSCDGVFCCPIVLVFPPRSRNRGLSRTRTSTIYSKKDPQVAAPGVLDDHVLYVNHLPADCELTQPIHDIFSVSGHRVVSFGNSHSYSLDAIHHKTLEISKHEIHEMSTICYGDLWNRSHLDLISL